MKYVMMFIETEQRQKAFEALDQAERDVAFEHVGKWFAEYGDKVTHQVHLGPAHTATTVRLDGPGDPVVTDGPFVEGKEIVSGFVEIDVADLDEALRMARTWPACRIVEIRPVA